MCSSRRVSSQPASRGSVRRKRSSRFIGLQVARGDELGAQLATGVVEGLVDGVARAAEALDERVGGNPVQHDGDERTALAVGQGLVDGLAQGAGELAPL